MDGLFGHCPRCSRDLKIHDGFTYLTLRPRCTSCGALIEVVVTRNDKAPAILTIKIVEKKD